MGIINKEDLLDIENISQLIKYDFEVSYKRKNKDVKHPERAHITDAGFDLYADSKEITKKYIQYGTGVHFEIPAGYVGLLFPRSSVTKRDLILKNCIGVIDSGYIGEVMARFYMTGSETSISMSEFDIYEEGDKICQIIFLKLPNVLLIEKDELGNTERGDGGFGSSDKK